MFFSFSFPQRLEKRSALISRRASAPSTRFLRHVTSASTANADSNADSLRLNVISTISRHIYHQSSLPLAQ
jgi:hypothetical protein